MLVNASAINSWATVGLLTFSWSESVTGSDSYELFQGHVHCEVRTPICYSIETVKEWQADCHTSGGCFSSCCSAPDSFC